MEVGWKQVETIDLWDFARVHFYDRVHLKFSGGKETGETNPRRRWVRWLLAVIT